PAQVHAERMEKFAATLSEAVDVVTARALLPLKSLITLCYPLLRKTGATALFPKGQNAELELAEASKSWTMHASMVASRTDSAGRIVVLRDLVPRAKTP